MIMKKLIVCSVIATLFLTGNPIQSMAAVEATPASTPVTNTVDAEKVNVLVKRLHEIDAMDKSKLSTSEKKILRKEVRVIKKDIQRASGGVYISVGVLLLIIIILLII
jgi:hypothetical protein